MCSAHYFAKLSQNYDFPSDTRKTNTVELWQVTAQVCTEKGIPLEMANGNIL